MKPFLTKEGTMSHGKRDAMAKMDRYAFITIISSVLINLTMAALLLTAVYTAFQW